MYVAMTRARNELLVAYPLHAYPSRYTADYSLDQLSRFLDRGVRETMQRVTVGPEDEAPAPVPAGPTPTVDLRAILRGKFGS
jgi:DNA helicase-2/ATP-dependent DNA helicase PcrA